MKVIIGYDGSESADAGLEDLKRAGLPDQTEALVVTVGEMWMPSTDAGHLPAAAPASSRVSTVMAQLQNKAEQTLKDAEDASGKAVAQLKSSFPKWQVETEIINGDAALAINNKAADWEADLIIIGTHDRGAIGRFFQGSVSRKVFTDANCSVRVARGAAATDKDAPPRIMIGVDGSPSAEQAINSVGMRVWPNGTEVKLIAVNDRTTPPARVSTLLPQATQMINSYNQSKETRVRSMMDWGTNELNIIGLKTSKSMEEGDAKKVLVEEARKWNADSIFVGTRDFDSSFERFRLGSVSTAVVTNAPCSVEVVRAFTS
jgi:nucleotide-binding universal stress UspA family protein